MSERIKGKCKYCGKEYASSYISRHLSACKKRQEKLAKGTGSRKRGYFELMVYSKYDKDYWLYVEMKETAVLKDLDQFLRDIWLECCGHLSSFHINNISYDAVLQDDYWDEPSKSMNCKLKTVLEKGMTFGYEYDFGTTTELLIRVTNYRVGNDRKEKLIVLSRNNPVEHICETCGMKPAVYVCTACFYEGNGQLCEDCAKTHGCGEEMLLPVCNSPRMGECAYCGSDIYPDQFLSDIEMV